MMDTNNYSYHNEENELAENLSKIQVDSKNKPPAPLDLEENNRNTFFPDSNFFIEADQHSPVKTQSPSSRPLPTPKPKSKTLPREPSTHSSINQNTYTPSSKDTNSLNSSEMHPVENIISTNSLHHSNSDSLKYVKPKTLSNSSVNTKSYDNLQKANDAPIRRERRPSAAPISYDQHVHSSHTSLPPRPKEDPYYPQNTYATAPDEGQARSRPSYSDSDTRSLNNGHSRPDSQRYRTEEYNIVGNNNPGYPPMNPASPSQSSQKAEIPTKEALEKYRQNAKKSHDPEVQLDFAKYLIETAALVLSNPDDSVDPQTARKLHSTLITEALKWIKRLSSQGIGLGKGAYPEAQFFLANCYNNGSLGLPVDHDKAFNLYVQASKQNHPAATYRTGVCYEFGAGTKRDHHRSLQFFRKAAALGDTAAMFKVGMVLLKGGLGQQPNPREGITWLKRAAAAADEENPHALHELASCYEKGGIPSIIADPSYSRELYTQAAQLGYAHSQFKLGVCYEQGLLTCPVDPRRSIAWFTRGAEQGDPECELALSGWYLTGSEGVLKQSDTEAYLWARKAADKGLAKAEYAVGYYSEVGIGVRQDIEEARRWYMRAAAQGNKRAMQRLSELKKAGGSRKGGPKSKEEAGCIIA